MNLEPIYEIERDAEGEPVRLWWCGMHPSWEDIMRSWREQAAPLIADIIAQTKSEDFHLLKARLRDAYPWGEYGKYWPSKIWRDECQRQLGQKPPLPRGGQKPVPEGQGRLFT